MDLTSIIDWAATQARLFMFHIFSYNGGEFISLFTANVLKTILYVLFILAWLGLFYVVVFFMAGKAFGNKKAVLNLLPLKKQIILKFVFYSIIYFSVILSLVSSGLRLLSTNHYYAISTTSLLIDKDDDEKQNILLKQLGIDSQDTTKTFNTTVQGPNKTYNFFLKYNFPDSISVPRRGTLQVCVVNADGVNSSCSDPYSYLILGNPVLDTTNKGIFRTELTDNDIPIKYANGTLTNSDIYNIILLMKDKGLLDLFNNNTNYIIRLGNENDSAIIFSPGAVHSLYMGSVNTMSSYALVNNKILLENLGVNEIAPNEVFYPWFLESKINHPTPELQIRNYNVDGVSTLYLNVLPYGMGGYATYIHDLYANNLSTKDIVKAVFSEDKTTKIVNYYNNTLVRQGDDALGATSISKYIGILVRWVYSIYGVAMSVFVIAMIIFLVVRIGDRIYLPDLLRALNEKGDIITQKIEALYNGAGKINNNMAGNILMRIFTTIVVGTALSNLLLKLTVYYNLLDIHYSNFSDLFSYFVWLALISYIVVFALYGFIMRGIVRIMYVFDKIVTWLVERF